jgi:hypothetical protein
VNPIVEAVEQPGLTRAWRFPGVFLAASRLMVWRLEALLDYGPGGVARDGWPPLARDGWSLVAGPGSAARPAAPILDL